MAEPPLGIETKSALGLPPHSLCTQKKQAVFSIVIGIMAAAYKEFYFTVDKSDREPLSNH